MELTVGYGIILTEDEVFELKKYVGSGVMEALMEHYECLRCMNLLHHGDYFLGVFSDGYYVDGKAVPFSLIDFDIRESDIKFFEKKVLPQISDYVRWGMADKYLIGISY